MMLSLLLLLLGAASVTSDPVDVDFNDFPDRIIGGIPAAIEDFPFIVSMTSTFVTGFLQIQQKCGGTIITVDWVLTAGHCLQTTLCYNCLVAASLRGGSRYDKEGGVVRNATEVVETDNEHDIALIKVNEPWPLNGETISLGRLPQQGAPIPGGRPATIMGWGGIDKEGTAPGMLMKAQVQVLSHEDCSATFGVTQFYISDLLVCTFDQDGERYGWHGDSGGPVVADGQVVGIVSAGVTHSHFVLPDIHTRVSSYIDWIEQAVGPLP